MAKLKMWKATHIEWDVDIDDALAHLTKIPLQEAAAILNIPKEKYANMTAEERDSFASNVFRQSPVALYKCVGLPLEILIPEDMEAEDVISIWLSNTYGYSHKGFVLELAVS